MHFSFLKDLNFSEVELSGAAIFVIFIFFMVNGYMLISVISWYRRHYPRRLKDRYRAPLRSHCQFYRSLNPREQKRFERKVQLFINNKEFISRSRDLTLSDAMVARIAAAAVELTFGFKRFGFEHFKRIIIYADNYYSKISKRYHRGEVHPGGMIILSWKAFQEGYADDDDGLNLGIHEMAHALKLENRIVNGDYQFLPTETFREYRRRYEEIRPRIKAGHDPVFRKYAAVNLHEFFAISCENFLERPRLLFRHHQKIYQLMSEMLRQDPLERLNFSGRNRMA